ncbi:uncharacterized protein LOC125785859 [Astyanax mexicanus]|uniref:uncharacterized protein LOC125785859 n=1 Tax=Astyanax mexicanus TaxID=7994 RepID=UPI0020CB5D34|nr:uncharacterized protein LOC125785859 [Astyanax mexicanus]
MAEAATLSAIEKTTVGVYVTRETPGSDSSDVGIIIEGVVVLQDLGNVALAVAMLFGLFYSLNMRYPSQLHFTFEVIQKLLQIGPAYGRKMMTGYLSSKGIWASEVRVGHMLRTVNQPYHTDRCHGAKNLNPMPYNAEYMGHKLHMDQNEKLVMFGVTHVLAIDGYSSKIVGHSTMPVKNNLLIYQDVYRNSVLQHGIWDQIRVDHGREFFLTLFIQEKLAGLRFNTDRQAYIQSHSTQVSLS